MMNEDIENLIQEYDLGNDVYDDPLILGDDEILLIDDNIARANDMQLELDT